jgi:hypothetical protein
MSVFLSRWWENTEVKDPQIGEKTFNENEQRFCRELRKFHEKFSPIRG